MAQNPTVVVNEERIGDGKKLGNTGQKAVIGSAGGSALATIIAYILVRSGIEVDPTQATVLAGSIAIVVSAVATALLAKFAPTSGGIIQTVLTSAAEPITAPVEDMPSGVPFDPQAVSSAGSSVAVDAEGYEVTPDEPTSVVAPVPGGATDVAVK